MPWAWGLQGTIETNVSTTGEQYRKMLLILHKPHNIYITHIIYITYLKHIGNIIFIKHLLYIKYLKVAKTHNKYNKAGRDGAVQGGGRRRMGGRRGRARARLRNVTVVVHKVWRRRPQVIAWIR